jgi:hypothetical protein
MDPLCNAPAVQQEVYFNALDTGESHHLFLSSTQRPMFTGIFVVTFL